MVRDASKRADPKAAPKKFKLVVGRRRERAQEGASQKGAGKTWQGPNPATVSSVIAAKEAEVEAHKEKVAALLFSDAHLSPYIWPQRREIKGDAEFALEWLLRKAIEYQPDYVISAGDLFDADDPDPAMIRQLRLFIETLDAHGIGFAFIDGNHDKQSVAWPRATSGRSMHLHGKMLKLGANKIVGLDHQSVDLREAIQALPVGNVYICHQRWRELADHGTTEGSVQFFPKGCTIFTGDLHLSREEWGKGQRKIISPGATHMRAIDEPINFSYYLLTKGGKWIRQALPSRHIIRGVFDNDAELDRYLDEFSTVWEEVVACGHLEKDVDVRKPLLIIRYNPTMERVKWRVTKTVEDRMHVIVKPLIEESFQRDSDDVPIQVRGSLLEYIEHRVPKNDPRYDKLVSLVKAEDKKAAVAELRGTYGL